MLTAISLFSGIGGIDLALVGAGFTIIAQVEIDPFCREVLRKNDRYWKNTTRFTDVRYFNIDEFPSGYGCDIMAGGFPCQPHSQAGLKRGADDERDLWHEFARCIGEFRPRVVFLENVPNITNTIGTRIVSDLATMGYDATWGVVSASDIGAPHVRKRWWLVAYARSIRLQTPNERFSQTGNDSQLAGEISGGILSEQCGLTKPIQLHRTTQNGTLATNTSGIHRGINGLSDWMDRYTFPPRPNNWQPPNDVKKTRHGTRKTRIKALGNAVVPQVVYPIVKAIYDQLTK